MSIHAPDIHRLARIIEYARVTPRYDVTLYLDDDMYACPSVNPLLGAALLDLAATADVRLVERWLSQGQLDPGTEESRAVAQWLYEGRPPHLFRRFDLQGGAVLLRRSPAQIRFAQILRETYVDMWTGKQHQKRDHRGKDQPALDAAALRFVGRSRTTSSPTTVPTDVQPQAQPLQQPRPSRARRRALSPLEGQNTDIDAAEGSLQSSTRTRRPA